MRAILALTAACAVLFTTAVLADTPQLTPQQQERLRKIGEIAANLHPQTGDVKIADADATLHLGSAYYFIPSAEARRILIEAWGNEKSAGDGVLGLVFPANTTFMDPGGWSAVITFHPDGYVSDENAKSADYDQVLKDAQSGEDEENNQRKSEGLPPMHLKGWAQAPYYDLKHHTLIWARDFRVGNQTDDTLNYDLRALGRKGVLSMNILSTMSELGHVRTAAGALQNVATFNAGARYADYQAGVDKKAEYGVAGLVAAGLGVALAQKLGLLGIALLFLKKFAVVAIAAAGGGIAWLRRLFGRKDVPPPATTA